MRIKTIRTTVPTEVERDGETYMVNKRVDRKVVTVPDVHRAVRRAVTAATVLIVGIALAWSVTSIGGLLSVAAPAWVAYLAAGAFDLSWAVLMAAEWTMQYDDRARIPRVAGWLALMVSMTAIATYGAMQATVWIGIIGAVISLLAKGLWTVMMMITAHPLSAESHQIVQQKRSRAGEELALVTVDRELLRIRQETAALRESESLTGVAWDAEGITRKQLAETLSDAMEKEEPNRDREHAELIANTANSDREHVRGQREHAELIANTPPVASANSDRPVFGFGANTPNMADCVREQIANTPDNASAVAAVMEIMPGANRASVAAAVRRARKGGANT